MTSEQIDQKIAELELWIEDNPGHENAYLVMENLKKLKQTKLNG